ncbi:MAG: exo-alpha-sialidase [Acidobacteria bacterium]|nr:exo-alpha-sialidase [Acidobacteriota bacterium]
MTKLSTAIVCLILMLTAACSSRSIMKETVAKTPSISYAPPVRVSVENTDASEPAVAAGHEGTAYVTWVAHREGGKADVYLSHFDSEGRKLGESVRVNPNEGQAKTWHGDPPTVATGPDRTIYVGWTSAQGEGHKADIYLSASRDNGRSFELPVKVNDDKKPAGHGMHSIAVAQDGRIYMVWLDERNVAPPPEEKQKEGPKKPHNMAEMNREVFFAVSTDGGRTFSPNQRISSEVCPCCKTSLAVGPDGRMYASWRQVLPGDFRHIAVASSNNGGKTFSKPVTVSDDQWMINGCPVSGSALSVGKDGILRVLWYTAGDAGKPGLYWAESRDGAQTFSPRKPFAEGSDTPVLISRSDNSFIAVWEKADGLVSLVNTAQLSSDGQVTAISSIANEGELPSGATAGHRLFIAYISRKEHQRSIWFVHARPVVQ